MAGVIAKGDAVISINSLETEAKLVFTPNPDGDEWDAAAINKLAAELKLHPPINPQILEPFLSKAAHIKTKSSADVHPVEMVLYEGIAPVDPVPESVTWEELPVPADMEQFAGEAGAVKPELYRIRIERIKNEKSVKKPGALPFLPQKDEVVVTWDKKEIKEIAEVNPEVKELKYANAGQKIGTIFHAVPGKPGKNIFGKFLPPAQPNSEAVLLGHGIKKEKNDLIAEAPGFLRIGGTWADLIPLGKPCWKINTGIDGYSVFLSFTPGDPRFPKPDASAIIAEAASGGIPQTALITAQELDTEIEHSIKNHISLESFPLMAAGDAAAGVIINKEKTRAVLHLRKGTAGRSVLEMKAISRALKESGVHIADFEKLKADIHTFMTGKDLELNDYVLAEGKLPSRGGDREVKLSAALLPDDDPILSRLKQNWNKYSDNSFLLTEFTGAAIVEKGAEAARVEASAEGEAGYDIFGSIIPAMPGNDPQLKLLRGLELHGGSIRAQKSGLLLLNQAGNFFKADLIEFSDAKIEITVTEDKMEARGDLFRESGPGNPLTPDTVISALSDQGVVKIDAEAVKTACSRAAVGGSCLNAVLASGEAPVRQGSRQVKWLVHAGLAHNDKSQVKSGTVIAELSQAMENGRPGFNVMGEEIPCEEGPQDEIVHDNTVKEIPVENGIRLAAVCPGELVFDGKTLGVNSMREINGDAGKATGNIEFSGEIKVGGKVSAGFSVIGGLNVTINGAAEEALVSSGGSVKISGGIRGGGKGVVRARGTIEAPFAEKATIMAVGDVRLAGGAVLTVIKTNGALLIESRDGRFQGGSCQARHGVNIANLGSATGGHTEIFFGQDYLIKDQIGETEEEINKIKLALAGIDKKLSAIVKQIPESKNAAGMLEKFRSEKVRLIKILEVLKPRLFALEEKFEEHYESEVKIRGTVYPGVVIESHGRYLEVQQARSGVIFYFDRSCGQIKEKSITAE
ncbi:MAG: FapA family protein [Treponema sp.]|nr:FapA family protein [Treponema sp.]